jgi:hypothetical protein
MYKTIQLKDKNKFLTTGYISNNICNTLTKYYFSYLNCSFIKVCNKFVANVQYSENIVLINFNKLNLKTNIVII